MSFAGSGCLAGSVAGFAVGLSLSDLLAARGLASAFGSAFGFWACFRLGFWPWLGLARLGFLRVWQIPRVLSPAQPARGAW